MFTTPATLTPAQLAVLIVTLELVLRQAHDSTIPDRLYGICRNWMTALAQHPAIDYYARRKHPEIPPLVQPNLAYPLVEFYGPMWPNFSGNPLYPIRVIDVGEDKWVTDGNRLALRISLIEFILEQLRKQYLAKLPAP